MSDYIPTIIAASVALVVGFGSGWMSHALSFRRDRAAREHADRREKEARRQELLSTLAHWLQTFVVVTDPAESKKRYYFGGGIKELAAATEKFRGYVTDKSAFDCLNYHVSNMNPETLDANGVNARRDTICEAIRKLIAFIRDA